MRKLICLFFLCIHFAGFSQKQEAGILAGVSSYKGELNPVMLDHRFFSPAAGAFYRYNITRYFALKANAYYGFIKGDDSKSEDLFNKNRNLSFQSELLDISTTVEFNFFPYEIGNPKFPFTTYVFGGLSLFKFNPKANYFNPLSGQTTLEELQPLGTEGQGTTAYPERQEYSLTQIGLPMGVGLKVNVGQIGLGFEFGARYTFTDYLDDVSKTYADKKVLAAQNGERSAAMSDRSLSGDAKTGGLRGNPDTNDWYMFAGVTLYFRLDKPGNHCDPFHFLRREEYDK